MHDEHPHPLLVQIPLTVSPFIALPTPTPLPYTYRQLPSTLPPSVLQPAAGAPSSLPYNPNNLQDPSSSSSNPSGAPAPPNPPAYISSPSNPSHTSTPDSILSSCRALQHHLNDLETRARTTLQEWEDRRREEDLAEKRRVAPGWLDSGVHLLVPENVTSSGGAERREGREWQEGRERSYMEGEGVETEMEGVERTPQPRPEEPRRRTSVGVKAVVERRDGVPDPRMGEELDRAFGGMNLERS